MFLGKSKVSSKTDPKRGKKQDKMEQLKKEKDIFRNRNDNKEYILQKIVITKARRLFSVFPK